MVGNRLCFPGLLQDKPGFGVDCLWHCGCNTGPQVCQAVHCHRATRWLFFIFIFLRKDHTEVYRRTSDLPPLFPVFQVVGLQVWVIRTGKAGFLQWVKTDSRGTCGDEDAVGPGQIRR